MTDQGAVTGASGDGSEIARFAEEFLGSIAVHRHFDRELAAVPA